MPTFKVVPLALTYRRYRDAAFLRSVQLWSFLHGLVDLMITKPELPWPAVEDVVEASLEQLGLGRT